MGSVKAMTTTDVDDEATTLLGQANQRYTAGRRKLVAALQQGGGPITINQIVAIDPSLPQSTVYRNLTILEEAGVVTRIVTTDDFARYELAEHLTGHHHHLICTSCGDVADFSLTSATEDALDKALHEAAHAAGFTPDAHQLDLVGTCSNCS